jgi:hypothetical protein
MKKHRNMETKHIKFFLAIIIIIIEEKSKKTLPWCCQEIYLPTPPHLLSPDLSIQIWSNVKKKQNNISSKKLEKQKEKI